MMISTKNLRTSIQVLTYLLLTGGFLCIALASWAQQTVQGKVIDQKNGQPLAFVNIVEVGAQNGISSDIDGKFVLTLKRIPAQLQFSYLGYERFTVSITEAGPFDIKIALSPTNYQLNEVVILPGINPADIIIKRVSNKRDTLNPQKLNSFTYTTYNKILVTANQDSLQAANARDSLSTVPVDSNDLEARQILNTQHLFINESVTERFFLKPDNSFENVIASRTSGLNNPIISSLTTQLQSLSFYDEYFSLLGTSYLNPLSKNSTNFYAFQIEDTTFDGSDTVIVISFRPRLNKNFEGMEGVLNVNKKHYALVSAIAHPAQGDARQVHIAHYYQRVDSIHWFPYQLNTDIVFSNFTMGKVPVIIQGRTYIRKIQVNPPLKRNQFGAIAVDVEPDALEKADVTLPEFRQDPLTARDSATYHVIDSIGKALKFDRRFNTLEALVTGKLRVKWIDFDLTRILSANRYEAVRLGFGLSTNERLVKWWSIGGYFGYGFKDRGIKYGAFTEFILHRRSDTRIRFDYRQDIAETGSMDFSLAPPLSLDNFYRSIAVSSFDSLQQMELSLRFKPTQNLHMRVSASHSWMNPTYAYQYLPAYPDTLQEFRLSELNLTMRWGIKEKYLSLGRAFISLGTKYPVVWFSATQNLPVAGGMFSYTKLQAQIEQTFTFKKAGRIKLQAGGGAIFGDVPYQRLFNMRGSYMGFSIVSRGSFETVMPNEFASDRFAFFLFDYKFGPLFKLGKLIKPEISVIHNIGWGDVQNPNRHQPIPFKTMKHGLFEGGLVLDNILVLANTGFGVGVFYRYGAYASTRPEDNIYVKLALNFGF